MNKLKELIGKVRNHSYLKNKTPDLQNYRDFKETWFEMREKYWDLVRGSMPSYEDAKDIPHKNTLFSCKSGLLVWMMTHDINSTLLYYFFYKNLDTGEPEIAFNFQEFWEGSLSKVLDIIERWIDEKDNENPDTISFKYWHNRELKERNISVYNISGTPWWREAEYITKSQIPGRLENSMKLLEDFKKYDEEHQEKYGWRSDYHKRVLGDLQSEIDLLNGKIGNDKSTWLVIKDED